VQPVGCLAEPERALGAEAEAGLDGQRDAGRERQIGVVGAAGARGDRAEDQPFGGAAGHEFGQQIGVIGDQAGARGAADAGLAAGAVQRDVLDLAMAERRRHQRVAAFVDGDAPRHRGVIIGAKGRAQILGRDPASGAAGH
jgi:hypothetical protein